MWRNFAHLANFFPMAIFWGCSIKIEIMANFLASFEKNTAKCWANHLVTLAVSAATARFRLEGPHWSVCSILSDFCLKFVDHWRWRGWLDTSANVGSLVSFNGMRKQWEIGEGYWMNKIVTQSISKLMRTAGAMAQRKAFKFLTWLTWDLF